MLQYIFYSLLLVLASLCYKLIVYPIYQLKTWQKQLGGKAQILFFPVYGLFYFLSRSLKYIYKFRGEQQSVSAILTNFKAYPAVFLTSPEYIKYLAQSENSFTRRVANVLVKEMWMRESLFLNPHWRRQRKMLGPYFHHDRLRHFTGAIEQICLENMGDLESIIERQKDKQTTLKTLSFSSSITGESIVKFFFSEDFRGIKLNGKPAAVEVQDLLTELFFEGRGPLVQLKRFLFGFNRFLTEKEKNHLRRIKEMHRLAKDLIEKRRLKLRESKSSDEKSSEQKDLLTVYIEEQESQRGKSVSPEELITEDEIIHQFLMLFFAGTDTTGHLTAMSIYCLAKYPETYEKIAAELKENGSNDTPLTYDSLSKMPYLGAFIKEVLRLFTPVVYIFPRISKVDQMLGDLKIKKGDIVSANLVGNLMNPKFFPNPEQFDPERWLKGDDAMLDPFAFIPFFSGPRHCIGQHLALLEAKIILIHFVRRFKVKLNPLKELKMVIKFLRSPLDDELVIVERK